jgi:hypothetical protein
VLRSLTDLALECSQDDLPELQEENGDYALSSQHKAAPDMSLVSAEDAVQIKGYYMLPAGCNQDAQYYAEQRFKVYLGY